MTNLHTPVHSRDPAGGLVVESDDGSVAFRIARTSSGVLVERHQLRSGGRRIVLSSIFRDQDSFRRWCDADTVRFDYPLVHQNLKRNGQALLDRSA